MNKISLIFTVFILFSIYHNSFTLGSEKCECDIFQVSKNFSEKNSPELTKFTKQSGEINGRPFYFSIKDEEKNEIVWWNDAASSWMLQTYDSYTDITDTILEVQNLYDCPNLHTGDWKIISEGRKGVIKSRCLADKNKCPVNGEII